MLKYFFIVSPKARTFKMAGIILDSGERTREYEEFPFSILVKNKKPVLRLVQNVYMSLKMHKLYLSERV